jgi:L-asparaginase
MSDGTVLMIYTGGTIGMVPQNDLPGSPLEAVQDERRLTENIPQLEALRREVPFELVRLENEVGVQVGAVDSSDIDLRHWTWLAKQIERSYQAYAGFVILHGTDTMAYTASALSYMLSNLSKPVIITGAQIPMSRYDTDGVWNFVRAVQIAGYSHTNQQLVPEVCICFNDSLFRGNRVRKMSTSSAQGFVSPNYPVLGHIGDRIKIHPSRIADPADNRDSAFFADATFDARVLDFTLFPGITPEALEKILGLDAVQGMVLRTFGAGNAPNNPELHGIIGNAVDAGKVIVNVTPCFEGQVEPGMYAASAALSKKGVTDGVDMTPEAALTKLMWLLGTVSDRAEVRRQMQVNHRGELSERGRAWAHSEGGDPSYSSDAVTRW